MKYINLAKKILKSFDLFTNSQFLRYQQDGEYKTASGGICSLVVIVVFMTLFMSTAIQTINMQIINWTSTSELLFNPTETAISINPPTSPFMFGIKLLGMDLNENIRYFDITLVQREFINGAYETTPKFVEMVPCTLQHFSLTEDIRSNAVSLGIQKWLCPPIGYNFSVKGKYTSPVTNLLEIRLNKCNATKYPSRPCAIDSVIDFYEDAFEQFIFSLNFINPLINPGNQDYLSYYIEDKSYIKFTRKLGADSTGHIEDYVIETDMSLLPFAKNVVDQGVIIPDIFQNIAFEVTNDRYASFFFMKSARSTSYARSFNKLDTFFSYVGGLVGTILGFMFVVGNFTSMAYELQLAQRIYRYAQDKRNDFSSFNLLSYGLFVFYGIGKMCGLGKKWETMKQIQACSGEVAKQLDIQLILERLLFLQRAADTLLEQHQIHGLHMHRLDTLKEIKKRRKRYGLRHGSQGNESEQDQPQESSSGSHKNSSLASQHQLSQFEFKPDIGRQKESSSKNNQVNTQAKIKELTQKTIAKLREESSNGNTISKRILEGIDDGTIIVAEPVHNRSDGKQNVTIDFKPTQIFEFQFLE